jgi:hypothetical protein
VIYQPNSLWSPKINIELDTSLSENISSHNVNASFYAIHWGFMSQFFNIISWDYGNEHIYIYIYSFFVFKIGLKHFMKNY